MARSAWRQSDTAIELKKALKKHWEVKLKKALKSGSKKMNRPSEPRAGRWAQRAMPMALRATHAAR